MSEQSPFSEVMIPETLQVDDQPASSTMQETPLEETGVSLVLTQGKEMSSKGLKRQRASAVQWDDKSTYTLLRAYEELWTTHLKKGNFRTKDWEDLTIVLNKEIDGTYNSEQVRNRIDTLKKTHKKELAKVSCAGATPSTWPLFDMCDNLWKIPKAAGIAGALDSDSRKVCLITATTETPINLDDQEGGSSSQEPQPQTEPSATKINIKRVVGKKERRSTQSPLSALACTIGASIKGLTTAYIQVEEKKIAVFRELEMRRMEHEERLTRIREEEETKRQQNYLAVQLEIAKLVARRQE